MKQPLCEWPLPSTFVESEISFLFNQLFHLKFCHLSLHQKLKGRLHGATGLCMGGIEAHQSAPFGFYLKLLLPFKRIWCYSKWLFLNENNPTTCDVSTHPTKNTWNRTQYHSGKGEKQIPRVLTINFWVRSSVVNQFSSCGCKSGWMYPQKMEVVLKHWRVGFFFLLERHKHPNFSPRRSIISNGAHVLA